MPSQQPMLMEFHVSRQARDLYQFDQSLFAFNGNVIFANFHAARLFAQKMNARRDLVNFPERAVRAGQINAMGLLDEILHYVVHQYRQERNPQAFDQALQYLYEAIGEELVDQALHQFLEQFPPLAVYRGEQSARDWLESQSTRPDGSLAENRELALEEMLMLWLANMNPALAPFMELFDDALLKKTTVYPNIMAELHDFFDRQPPFGPDNQNLIDMLRAPAIAFPHSLSAQLEFVRTRWSQVLGRYLYRLLSSLDLIREEEKIVFGFGGGGPAVVPEFAGLEREPERFSPDREWMPNLVLLAKNSYVWLDQLSKKYKRAITRLDEVPDEELDTLARWGFTGLWLIGLWERSPASRRIKQLRGNPEAVASAYSIFNYDIAQDLGGEDAYRSLRDRAWKRGIRLASDMVPNHMGIDSPWVIEHPDWFVSVDYSPFPSYTFNGPNLSWDSRVGIYLEDHYYDSTDAAVVFKRVDFWTGSEKYIYHGNDGTSMPWNDTAQLNYLNPEVREAVIQTILHVARKFSVIRFDAAMTLAKKHYQRLWYPQPGSGGDIPSRAEHALTKEQFDELFPNEFWREVVDRVAQEVPDTLLLAEAFWLMEGYFVRTLGMHRVYNSAFMNMLRDEKNQEYRLAIKNTLEFDPEILKRYVNFMNNPDERTAVDQFGKGDKYFGIATMMVTMPGLPMFGHGQVEGYAEKYGMEFRRAYWDERPDGYLVERHEREIFPLMRKRYLFAEVRNFLLYDFYTTDGGVNEDVFAYSNRAGDERSLVLYHNKFNSTRGWIRLSAAYKVKSAENGSLAQRTLGEGLDLANEEDMYVIFRDHVSGLEYIRSNREIHERGLYVELDAYKVVVFLDFRQVKDNEWRQYAQLAEYLAGRGVPSMDEALKEIFLQPVHQPYRELVNPGFFHWLVENRCEAGEPEPENFRKSLEEAQEKAAALLWEIRKLVEGSGDVEALSAGLRQDTAAALRLPALGQVFPAARSRKYKAALKYLHGGPGEDYPLEKGESETWGILFAYLFTRKLAQVLEPAGQMEPEAAAAQSRTWIDEFLLGKLIAQTMAGLELSEQRIRRAVSLVKVLTSHQNWHTTGTAPESQAYRVIETWLRDAEFQSIIGVNRYQEVLWFNKEAFDEVMWWLFTTAVIDLTSGKTQAEAAQVAKAIAACYEVIRRIQEAEERSRYQVELLIDQAKVVHL